MTADNDADTSSPIDGEDAVVWASGEIDMATAPVLVEAVTDALAGLAPGGRLVFDVTAVTFMDSAGLKAIALACQNVPGRVVVRNPATQVRRLLDISGIGRFVEIEG